MSAGTLHDPVQLTCSQCRRRACVRSRAVLKPGAKSTCAGCGARFHVVSGQTAETTPEQVSEADTLNRTEAPPHQSAPTLGPPKTYRASFSGSGGSLFGLHVVNVFLTLITLTIYSFWAKVRIRHYLYSQTQFAGDRFAYHGTGQELLNGATRATLVFGLPYMVISNAPRLLDGGMVILSIAQILSALLVLVSLPVAVVGARRYRLSRSSWRGIRFSFRGRAADFMTIFLTGALMTGVTLGAYYPVFNIRRQAHLIEHSYVGHRAFAFDGDDWGVATDFVWAVMLLPVTLGLSWFWYSAARQRYLWNHTLLGSARFSCTMEGWALTKLRLGNLLLLLISLGFAWPWTAVRNARFTLGTLSLKGPVDFDGIVQEAQSATTTGEGLSGFLDSGFDLG